VVSKQLTVDELGAMLENLGYEVAPVDQTILGGMPERNEGCGGKVRR